MTLLIAYNVSCHFLVLVSHVVRQQVQASAGNSDSFSSPSICLLGGLFLDMFATTRNSCSCQVVILFRCIFPTRLANTALV